MGAGKLLVLEGSCDGIGKTTQYNKLKERLVEDGETVVGHHFPSYNTIQGALVESYLKGEFGNIKDMSPYLINSFYACDRAVTWNNELKGHYEKGDTILLDRYTTSSLIYQASTIKDEKEKIEFIKYVIDYEYNRLRIQEPDDIIYLHVPFDLATELRNARKENEGIKKDIHESNLEFMKMVYENSLFIADYLNWSKVECSKNGEMRSINDINNEVYERIRKK
ncbi:MAG TPA: deoxynucleoside kinase [Bacilli bacterium]|nr:deoxynucleoside kinase [Bacilli bacterium]HPZ23564.1 deoxynucleoside kinase [Bacilli bacterium]HQC83813.1 deoxynucleoside kinase [Bacilli bacterium]